MNAVNKEKKKGCKRGTVATSHNKTSVIFGKNKIKLK